MHRIPTTKGYLVERVVDNDHVTNWRMNVRVILDYALADALVERANKILDDRILDEGLAATEAAELVLLDPTFNDYDVDDLRYEISEIEVY